MINPPWFRHSVVVYTVHSWKAIESSYTVEGWADRKHGWERYEAARDMGHGGQRYEAAYEVARYIGLI